MTVRSQLPGAVRREIHDVAGAAGRAVGETIAPELHSVAHQLGTTAAAVRVLCGALTALALAVLTVVVVRALG